MFLWRKNGLVDYKILCAGLFLLFSFLSFPVDPLSMCFLEIDTFTSLQKRNAELWKLSQQGAFLLPKEQGYASSHECRLSRDKLQKRKFRAETKEAVRFEKEGIPLSDRQKDLVASYKENLVKQRKRQAVYVSKKTCVNDL